MITALSKTPKMFVIDSNSTFTYKGKPAKVQQVAEELGVRYVLEGSFRKAEDRVRASGLRYRNLAENIQMSRGWEDPARKAVDSWLDSRSHRKAMLEPDFLETGVGVALGADGTFYFTQLYILRYAPQPPSEGEPVSP